MKEDFIVEILYLEDITYWYLKNNYVQILMKTMMDIDKTITNDNTKILL